MINKVTPSFTSKVYITNYSQMSREQRERIKSPQVLRDIRKLEKNRNDDTVVISTDAINNFPVFTMSVSKKRNEGEIITTSDFLRDISNVPELYKELKQDLDNGKCCSTVTGRIAEYII